MWLTIRNSHWLRYRRHQYTSIERPPQRKPASRFKGLPDVHYGDDRHWVCGNMGFSEWTLTGTTPLGECVEVRGTDHLEFRDGKIIRKDSYWKI